MAVITRASGYVNYSTGTSGFIPQIWSSKLAPKFYKTCVIADISNTDYEGEIKGQGDTVKIRVRPNVAINDYEIGGTITYEKLNSTLIDLQIEHAKTFAFQIDDIDKYQSDIKELDSWSTDTSKGMAIEVDKEVLSSIYADVAAANTGLTAGAESGGYILGTTAAPVTLTKYNILDWIIDCGAVLDEQNIPDDGRWFTLPVWASGMLKKSDLKNADLTGDDKSPIRNGMVGMIDRFKIYQTNLMHKGTGGDAGKFYPVFGHKSALTFAAQMKKMETLRIQNSFGEYVRGLNVFGFQVVNDTAIGSGVIVKG
ncbi:MAG: hypothetical protein V4629_03085 [Pseudomonadota bacterium]